MKDLIRETQLASSAGLHFIALAGALAIPDICGALLADDGTASGARYGKWFDRWVAPRYRGTLVGADVYPFRCSMLHQARVATTRGRYRRILFVDSVRSPISLHNNVMNDALNLDVRQFCADVCECAEAWLQAEESDPVVASNLEASIRVHPAGLLPFISGIPVIC